MVNIVHVSHPNIVVNPPEDFFEKNTIVILTNGQKLNNTTLPVIRQPLARALESLDKLNNIIIYSEDIEQIRYYIRLLYPHLTGMLKVMSKVDFTQDILEMMNTPLIVRHLQSHTLFYKESA